MPPRSSPSAKVPPARAGARILGAPLKPATPDDARRRQVVEEAVDRFVADNDELLEDLAK